MTPRQYYNKSLRKLLTKLSSKHTDILFLKDEVSETKDLQEYFKKTYKKTRDDTRLIVTYYNHIWEPILNLASILGFRKKIASQNWLDKGDINNLLYLTGFEVISTQKRLLLPLYIPIISTLFNKYLYLLPIINSLCLMTYTIARKRIIKQKNYTVSIIIPAKNEAGNVARIPKAIPRFGKKQELIFVEGNSTDNTWKEIEKLKGVLHYKQKGRGKANAVRLGIKKATGEILMIYDADMTVDARDLPKFYNALSEGKGEFINGSRLVYPMEKDAMRTLNKLGNKMFSLIFTWIFGQRFKDTLCGTKAFFKKDYVKFKRLKDDPFGDFELIFGAIKNHLKVIEIPVRYKERVYGSTNISRFKHGLQLFKITLLALKEFKVW